MKDSIYTKDILRLTDVEILKEIEHIFGHKVVKPPRWTGWIVDSEDEYVKNGIVDVEKLRKLYDTGDKLKDYILTLSFTSLCNRPRDLFALIKQQSGSKVLEFGCGVSTHGLACAQRGCEVYAFDISTTMLNYSKERYKQRGLKASFLQEEEEVPSDYFDTIICTDVVEHVPDPLLLLYNFMDWLKIGGIVHFHVSKMKNYKKGHLPQAITKWFRVCIPILKECFEQVSAHNFILRKRACPKN